MYNVSLWLSEWGFRGEGLRSGPASKSRAACCLAASPSYILAGSDPEESLDPEFPPYGLRTCRWVYSDIDALCRARRPGIKEHFPSLTRSLSFCTSPVKLRGQNLAAALSTWRISFAYTCLSTMSVFISSLRKHWELSRSQMQLGKVSCLWKIRSHTSPFVAAVLQIQTFTR